MPTYNPDQIVGKTLTAKNTIKIRRYPSWDDKVVSTVAPGNPIGTVYSWVTGSDAISIWWQFYDANGKAFYCPHITGDFDISSLKAAGALTIEEVKKAKEKKERAEAIENYFPGAPADKIVDVVDSASDAAKTVSESVGKMVKTVGLIIGGAVALSIVLNINNRK